MQPEGEDDLKKKQLIELAIINGTYRNGANQNQMMAAIAAAAATNSTAAAAALRGSPSLVTAASRIIGSQLAIFEPAHQHYHHVCTFVDPLIMQQQRGGGVDASLLSNGGGGGAAGAAAGGNAALLAALSVQQQQQAAAAAAAAAAQLNGAGALNYANLLQLNNGAAAGADYQQLLLQYVLG